MSQFNTFYVPMTDEGAAQERLNRFLRSHRVLAVSRRDFPEGWGFCVEWIDGVESSSPFPACQREKVDYMKVLPPEVFARFSELRKRRKAIAEVEGVKAFVVMTDAQLAKAAELEKPTLADLEKIDGFGVAKCEKYGRRLLELAADGSRGQPTETEGAHIAEEGPLP